MLKEEVINNILYKMSNKLNQEQLQELKTQLYIALTDVDLSKKEAEIVPHDNFDIELLQKFAKAKLAEDKSKNTVKNYLWNIKTLIYGVGKSIKSITSDDIRNFLYSYAKTHNVNRTTLRNMRAVYNSFFGWLRKNGYIDRNPVDLIDTIRPADTIKEPYLDEDIVKLRDACTNIRDLALVDFLNASMARVSEVQKLNINDIVFNERECLVIGKGQKQREVYFDGNAKVHLEQYLASRTDNNPALFVDIKKPHERLTTNGIRTALKRLGDRADVEKVHPHRFRRTGATRNLERGMSIDQVKNLLGHVRIDTTMIYAKTNKNLVKMNYQRFNSL